MDPKTAEMLAFIQETPFSHETRMGTLLRLLSPENVGPVMRAMPDDLRQAFEACLRDLHLEDGEPFNVSGRAVPTASTAAARSWLARDVGSGAPLAAAIGTRLAEFQRIATVGARPAPADLRMLESSAATSVPRVSIDAGR